MATLYARKPSGRYVPVAESPGLRDTLPHGEYLLTVAPGDITTRPLETPQVDLEAALLRHQDRVCSAMDRVLDRGIWSRAGLFRAALRELLEAVAE